MSDKNVPIRPVSDDFESLVSQIKRVSDALQQDARMVINRNVTTRAWLTGYYIIEYEQHGKDRAKYGEHLLQNLSKRLGGTGYGVSNLKNFRQFYLLYPEMKELVCEYVIRRFYSNHTQEYTEILLPDIIRHSLTGELGTSEIGHSQNGESGEQEKQQSVTAELLSSIHQPVVAYSSDGFAMLLADGAVKPVPQMLFDQLSFTHIVQLLHVEDSLQRTFYAARRR